MVTRERWNVFEIDLSGLRSHDADPESVKRIRARCLGALRAQRQKERAGRLRFTPWWEFMEPAAALGLSVIYLAAAFSSALALLR